MNGIRFWSRRNYDAALLIVALALFVKAVLPAGYMVGPAHDGPVFFLCTSVAGAPAAPAAGGADGDGGQAREGVDTHCAFSALSMGTLGTVLVFLVAALAYVFLLALWPVSLRPDLARFRLVPPLRGPPLNV